MNVLFMVYHMYLHLVYIGITTMALAAKIRKHMTYTPDCSNKMCVTDLSHWGILPLQFVDNDWLVSVSGGTHTAGMQLMLWHRVMLPMATPIATVGSTRKVLLCLGD